MFKQHLKTTLRSILLYKFHSFITIAGLATGIAACLLIIHYVSFEFSYESSQPEAKRIYRIRQDRLEAGILKEASAQTFGSVGPQLKAAIPGVEETTGIFTLDCIVTATGKNQSVAFNEPAVYFVDSSFLTVFSFPLLQASKEELNEPGTVILTAKVAARYFGSQNPVGLHLKFENHNQGLLLDAVVKGVCEDPPLNSQLQFNFLVFAGRNPAALAESWSQPDTYTYILLGRQTSVATVEAALPTFTEAHTHQQADHLTTRVELSLQPFSSVHLYSHLKGEISGSGNGLLIWVLTGSALLVLLIAYCNFISLATSKSAERVREARIRLVLGSGRTGLIWQYLTESLLYNLISLGVALLLVLLALPFFESVTGIKGLSTGSQEAEFFSCCVIILFTGTLFTAIYPAIFLSSGILTEKHRPGNGIETVRKSLIIFQFGSVILLMIGSLTVYRQVQFMLKENTSIDMSRTLVIAAPESKRETRQQEENYLTRLQTFLTEARRSSAVQSISLSSGIPGEQITWLRPYKRRGGVSTGKAQVLYPTFSIGQEFISQLKLRIIAGKELDAFKPPDSSTGRIPVMLNEAAVNSMGFKDPASAIGKIITDRNAKGRVFEYEITCVSQNFHQSSFKNSFVPIVFQPENGQGMKYFLIKVAPGGTEKSKIYLSGIFRQQFTGAPWQYFFLDKEFNQQYLEDERFGILFRDFTLLALLIACMGLLGLIISSTARRRKEIGIRKVIGASVLDLAKILSAEFIWLIGLATLITLPLAWLGIRLWLQHYAFHIGINCWIFLLPVLLTGLAAVLTVSVVILKAAMENPAGALRNK